GNCRDHMLRDSPGESRWHMLCVHRMILSNSIARDRLLTDHHEAVACSTLVGVRCRAMSITKKRRGTLTRLPIDFSLTNGVLCNVIRFLSAIAQVRYELGRRHFGCLRQRSAHESGGARDWMSNCRLGRRFVNGRSFHEHHPFTDHRTTFVSPVS